MKIVACPTKVFIVLGSIDLKTTQVLCVEGSNQKVLDLPSTIVSVLPTENDAVCVCEDGTYLLKVGLPRFFRKFPEPVELQSKPVCIAKHVGRPLCADICDGTLSVIEDCNEKWMLRTCDVSTGDKSLPTDLEIPKSFFKNAHILSLLALPFNRLCGVLSSFVSHTDPPLWLLGLSDGNLYVLSSAGCDKLLNVGHQPVIDILLCPKSQEFPEIYDQIASIGKHGRIVLLSSKGGKVTQVDCNSPTYIESCCIQGSHFIYTDGNTCWRISLKLQMKGCNFVKLPFCDIISLTPIKNKQWFPELGLLSKDAMIYSTKPNYETQSGDSLPLSLSGTTYSLNPSDIIKQMHLSPSRLKCINKDKEIHEMFKGQLSCVTGDKEQLKKQVSVTAKVVRMELLEQEEILLEVTNNSSFIFRQHFWRLHISLSSSPSSASCRLLHLGNLKTGTHYKTSIHLPKGPLPQEVRISCALLLCPPAEYLKEGFTFQVLFVLSLNDVLLDQLHFLSFPTAIVKNSTREKSEKRERKIKTVVSVLKSMLDIGSKELLMLLLVDCEHRGVKFDSQERIKATLNDSYVEIFTQETDSLIIFQMEGENGTLISGIKASLIRRLKKLDLMTATDTATLPEAVTSTIQE